MLCILHQVSESVDLYSSHLNPIWSDTGFSGGPEKFYVSIREGNEHVTKISATALGATLDKRCSLELSVKRLSLNVVLSRR